MADLGGGGGEVGGSEPPLGPTSQLWKLTVAIADCLFAKKKCNMLMHEVVRPYYVVITTTPTFASSSGTAMAIPAL